MFWSFYVFLLVAAIVLTFILILLPFSVLIHELGHAIPALCFTKDKVKIFVGSLGDEAQSRRLSINRLEVFLIRKPFPLRGGLCRFEQHDLSFWRHVTIICGGAAANLTAGALILSILRLGNVQGLPAALLYLFCIHEGLLALYNLVPSNRHIMLHDGTATQNDGALLKQQFELRSMPPAYFELTKSFQSADWQTSADRAEALLGTGLKKKNVYKLAVAAHIQLKSYERAMVLQQEQVNNCGALDINDQGNKALLMIMTGQHAKAIRYSEHLLQRHGKNIYLLNNLGYVLTLEGRYQEAIRYLDAALAQHAAYAYSYANRAYAWLQLGELEQGESG